MKSFVKQTKSTLIAHALCTIRRRVASQSVEEAERSGEKIGRLFFIFLKNEGLLLFTI